jgi:hypothetical protein
MKILIKCDIKIQLLADFTWIVLQLGPTEYQCTGYHPVAARLDIIKDNIIIH